MRTSEAIETLTRLLAICEYEWGEGWSVGQDEDCIESKDAALALFVLVGVAGATLAASPSEGND